MADQRSRTVAAGSPTSSLRDSSLGGRLRPVWLWLALGVATTIAGGLVAAIVAHDPSEKPVWASAYLVLVAGLGESGLALGRALLAPRPSTYGEVTRDFGLFALGNLAVVIGTLTDLVWLVDVGGVLLVLALALMAWGMRSAAEGNLQHPPTWVVGALWAYRVLVVVLLVSIPVGLLLARH